MYNRDQLIIDRLPVLFDYRLAEFKHAIITGQLRDIDPDPYSRFKTRAIQFFQSSARNSLSGLDEFASADITMGCNHFIDNLIMKQGLAGLQILEHDYSYYSRLNPGIIYCKSGYLVPKIPLLIAAPFPGYLDLHPNWEQLLDECFVKEIPVHIDACWLGSANDVHINLSNPCIKSIAVSLSKGVGMGWNRVGLRWSREEDPTDSITIYNQHDMIPESLVRNGLLAIDEFDIDYLWDTYGDKHRAICRELYLRPSKIIHACFSIDRSKLYGLRTLLEKEAQ
jgi:hypothetical protein